MYGIVSYSKYCGGNPQSYHPPRKRGWGVEYKPIENCAKKRRIGNSHGHLLTRLGSEVMSATSSLEIELVKDGDSQTGPVGRSINIDRGKGVKEEGAGLAAHTMAPV